MENQKEISLEEIKKRTSKERKIILGSNLVGESEILNHLKDLKAKSSDPIFLAQLYRECNNILFANKDKFPEFEMKEIDPEFESEIVDYVEGTFGMSMRKERIKDYVMENKIKINSAISLFFSLFSDGI